MLRLDTPFDTAHTTPQPVLDGSMSPVVYRCLKSFLNMLRRGFFGLDFHVYNFKFDYDDTFLK